MEELEEQLQPLPDVDYMEFFSNDTRWIQVLQVIYKNSLKKSYSNKLTWS